MGWSDLPCDLVISIAAHLWEAGDYLRFRGVCRSWKSAVRGFRPSFFPWLAVTHSNGDPNKDELSFINHVANNRVYKGHMPCTIIKSSRISNNNKDGWMISVHEDGVVVISNPVTGAQFQHLPSFCTCFDTITRVFLSDNLFAFAVHRTDDADDHLILSAATPGDDTWSVINLSLPYNFDSIWDIVFHEADHKFYAVDHEGKLLSFCLTRFGGKTVISEVSTLSKGIEDYFLFHGPHLVSYDSNLFLLIMTPLWEDEFKMLKYCHDADTWIGIGMTNIDLGNNSLFFDSYGAKLLPLPQGEEGRLRRNCIYFIDYEDYRPSPYQLAKKARELEERAREEKEAGYIYYPCEGEEGYIDDPYDEEEAARKHIHSIVHVRIYDAGKGIVEPCFSTFSTSDFQLYSLHMWFKPSISINN